MFIFRLWRRVHKPFLFLIFTISSFLFLSNLSVVVSAKGDTVFTSNLNSFTDFDKMSSRMIVNDEESGVGAEMNVELNLDEDTVGPVPEIQQLPFCNKVRGQPLHRTTTTIPPSSSTADGSWGRKPNETEEEDSSEDTVATNSNGLKPGKHIVVATLDGQLSVLDHAGKLLWSFCTGHLFSSTISSLQLNEQGKYVKLIPSLTGGLYKYDGLSLLAMPLNADSLLKKSFKLTSDVVITGGKELRTFGVDVESGKLKYECGMDGCKTPSDISSTTDNASGIVLVVKKQLQTVRAIDSMTGQERWNFSVGTHELALAGVTEGCHEPAEDISDVEEPTQLFRMVIPEGLVFGADDQNKAIWKHKFDSPISQAWILENGRLKTVDPMRHSPLLDSPSLYVGIHLQQLYVQESHSTLRKVQDMHELEDASKPPLQIGWIPSSAIAPIPIDESNSAVVEVSSENTALAPLYLTPFYVYDRDQINLNPAIEAPPNSSDNICLEGDEEDEDDDVEEVPGNNDVNNEILLSLATLWFWWKEVLGISLITAVVLNILLMRPMAQIIRRRAIEDVLYQVNAFLQRRREQVLALPAPPPRTSTSNSSLETPASVRVRTSSSSSSNFAEDTSLLFSSQYLREFEPIQCLGRGAFGTVFEARKKIDDRTYAVKRIPLPNREKSRDRVMREVKALAKLDHKNIVRYFNAWIESPPQGWLEKFDPLWNSTVMISPTATFDNSAFGSGDYSSMPSFLAHRKKDYSEIFVHDKTPVENDSFIVFETGTGPGDGVSDSGADFCSRMTSRPSRIEEEWSDENENEVESVDPQNATSIIPCSTEMTNSKFFRRPTTLDIPSSTDNSQNHNSVSVSLNLGGSERADSLMYLYIQQELCQKRTLQDWMRAERERNMKQVLQMFTQIVEAVEYIHTHKLIHRDLKPSNIFLAGGKNAWDEVQDMTVKIGDFGLATTLVQPDLHDDFSTDFETETQTNVKLTGQVGTHLYMSPEQFHRQVYDHKVDIYSLGLIFFELIVPFGTDMERLDELTKVRKFQFEKSFQQSHPDQYELIQQMVSHDPDLRPNASEVKVSLSTQLETLPPADLNLMHSRSKSYPSNLTSSQPNHKLHDIRINEASRKSKHIMYKTRSAM